MEREEMAAELAHFTAVLRRAISRKEFASNKRATKDVLPPEPEVEAGGFAPDVLRAGKAHFTSVDEAGAAAAGAYDPFAASALGGAGTETAVRYCRPLWAVPEGGDGTRLQATLRFEPGVAHGDSVLVAGPDGEQLPLLTPPGVRNVCRILASVPAPSDSTGARAPEGTQGTGGLLVDVLPLGPNAAPQKRLGLDGGHELILPSYAAPFTSLVFATPIHLGDGARRVPSGASRRRGRRQAAQRSSWEPTPSSSRAKRKRRRRRRRARYRNARPLPRRRSPRRRPLRWPCRPQCRQHQRLRQHRLRAAVAAVAAREAAAAAPPWAQQRRPTPSSTRVPPRAARWATRTPVGDKRRRPSQTTKPRQLKKQQQTRPQLTRRPPPTRPQPTRTLTRQAPTKKASSAAMRRRKSRKVAMSRPSR